MIATSERQLFAGWAEQLGVPLSPAQVAAFVRWAEYMAEWGRRLNLTSIQQPRGVLRLHFLDSLTLWTLPEVRRAERLLDVGSGAGLPGLALKLVAPGLAVQLLESSQRKARYLEQLAGHLSLSDVAVLQGRAEDLAHQVHLRESYQLVVARALAPLPTLLEYCLPFCLVGGRVVAMKGPGADAELSGAANALEQLGGRLENRVDLVLPGGDDARSLLVFEKVLPTPGHYPRPPGLPSRRPL